MNRAPVMTAWATVVAERMGFKREEALSIGSWIALVFSKNNLFEPESCCEFKFANSIGIYRDERNFKRRFVGCVRTRKGERGRVEGRSITTVCGCYGEKVGHIFSPSLLVKTN